MSLLKISILHHMIKKNESTTSDELLLSKPTNLQAIDYICENGKCQDTKAIYEHLKKHEASNIYKETIGSITSELINQKILENKKSADGNSFRLITDKEKETLDNTTSHDNINNIENNDNQSDPSININPQTFIYIEEQDITQEISPFREPAINSDALKPLLQLIRETEPVINLDLGTSLAPNKKDHLHHNQKQINRLHAQISALKSHLKCEVSTMNNRIDLLPK